MLKLRSGRYIGSTAFFRNSAYLKTLVSLLEPIPAPRVLFHACSFGAEPLSFASLWRRRVGTPITIHATDIEPSFLALAPSMEDPRITAADRALVTFLEPHSVVTFAPDEPYDAVACMNALCYLSDNDQRAALRAMCSYAETYLCVTAARPAVLRDELEHAGFRPLDTAWLQIYYGWRERLRARHSDQWMLPYLPWLLPEWRYAGTSIFRRTAARDEVPVRRAAE